MSDLGSAPLPPLGRVAMTPELSAGKRRAIDEAYYSAVTRVAVQVGTRFWEASGLSGFASSDDPMELWHTTFDEPGPEGMLVAYFKHDGAREIAAVAPEARTAHACIVQLRDIVIVTLLEHDRIGTTAIVGTSGGKTIEHDLMIGAISRGLHDDAARKAQHGMQMQRALDCSARHFIRRAGQDRIALRRTEYVELTVAGERRRHLRRRARLGIERKIV